MWCVPPPRLLTATTAQIPADQLCSAPGAGATARCAVRSARTAVTVADRGLRLPAVRPAGA